MKTNLVLVLLIFVAFSGNSNLAETADLVVEVENLELSNAQAQDFDGASSKVVAFDVAGAEAKGQVELDRGVYKAYLYMFAPDSEQDAVYVAVGKTQERIYPSTHSILTESSSFNLNILEKKKYPISITFGEPGVLLDRLVIQSIQGLKLENVVINGQPCVSISESQLRTAEGANKPFSVFLTERK